jgi:hypothetical protein
VGAAASVSVYSVWNLGNQIRKKVNETQCTYHRAECRPTQSVRIREKIALKIGSTNAGRILSTKCPNKESKEYGQGKKSNGSRQEKCRETTSESPMQICDNEVVDSLTK